MSQPAVVAAVVQIAGQIAGLTDAQAGRPDTVPWTVLGALVYADAPSDLRRVTYSVLQITYTVHLDVLLGDQNLPEPDAYALAATLADGFRAAFWGDPTLGGVVFDSQLQQATDTLNTYRANLGSAQDRYADYPLVRWQLLVTEHIAASAAAVLN